MKHDDGSTHKSTFTAEWGGWKNPKLSIPPTSTAQVLRPTACFILLFGSLMPSRFYPKGISDLQCSLSESRIPMLCQVEERLSCSSQLLQSLYCESSLLRLLPIEWYALVLCCTCAPWDVFESAKRDKQPTSMPSRTPLFRPCLILQANTMLLWCSYPCHSALLCYFADRQLPLVWISAETTHRLWIIWSRYCSIGILMGSCRLPVL